MPGVGAEASGEGEAASGNVLLRRCCIQKRPSTTDRNAEGLEGNRNLRSALFGFSASPGPDGKNEGEALPSVEPGRIGGVRPSKTLERVQRVLFLNIQGFVSKDRKDKIKQLSERVKNENVALIVLTEAHI